MPYLKFVKREHKCVLPTSLNRKRGGRAVGLGTVWECPGCQKQWMVAERKLPGESGAEQFWRPMRSVEYIKKGE